MRFLTLFIGLMATSAFAQDWTIRDSDRLLDQGALAETLTGKTLVFYDDGQSIYNDDGTYSYTYGGGGTWLGYWRVEGESLVCVTFVTEVTRCDMIVQNGERLVLLTVDGQRFPIRDVEAAPSPDTPL